MRTIGPGCVAGVTVSEYESTKKDFLCVGGITVGFLCVCNDMRTESGTFPKSLCGFVWR